MVRQISAEAQAFLDQNVGTEPAVIIEIQWVEDGAIYTYSDKDLGGNEGKILDVSDLDNTVVVQGVQSGTSGDSQAISVTLDDTDGTIKNIIDNVDIHKQPCWVYQWFQGLSTDDKFLIFKGQVSSPMQWNEGDRTVSFDIITRIEDADVGFSMEEGDFEYVPENLVGQPWPLVFGTVRNCPALLTRSPRKAILKTGFGIRDFMLQPKKDQSEKVCCPKIFTGFRVTYEVTNVWGAGPARIQATFQTDARCTCKKRALACEIDLNIAQQAQYEYGVLEIIDGNRFPQGVFIRLNINGAIVSGTFSGDFFTVSNYKHPARDTIPIPEIKTFGCDPLPGTTTQNPGFSGQQRCILPPECGGWGSSITVTNYLQGTGSNSREQEAWNYLSSFREAGFFWAEPGSEVLLVGDDELVYVVNLLPSTVHYVKAWKTFQVSNLRQFTTVPNTYWFARLSNFVEYTTTEVVLTRPLTSRGEGWEDDIYVTLTSSVGPNTVDIMEWLINMYTDFTWDSSFASIKTLLERYPMHFRVPGRRNILQLLQEMAFQARCALTLRDDQFHLTYLSEEPSQDGALTESDILANSLVMDHTNTEDLVTKLVAEWRPSCDLEEPYKVILRYNDRRYGSQEETFDFYCFNIQELVLKSATFWLIRMANTWKKVICKVPINKLALESIDGVWITLPDIANGVIKCRVETAVYNSADHAIDFVLQTPVRSGEREPFPFHYPADISYSELHPTNEDLQFGNAGGSGPNVNVEAPQGHVLGQPPQGISGFSFGQKSPCESLGTPVGGAAASSFRPIDLQGKCRPDQGDQQPSDEEDKKPEVPLETDNSNVPPQQSPVNEFTEADIAGEADRLQQEGANNDLQQKNTNNTTGGTGSNSGSGTQDGAGNLSDENGKEQTDADKVRDYLDEMPDKDDLEEQNRCHWTITVYFLTPVTAVRIKVGDTCQNDPSKPPVVCESPLGWCYCGEQGKTGCWVGNQVPQQFEQFHFDSPEAREAARKTIQDVINSQGTVGQNHPAFLSLSQFTPPGCEGPGDEEAGLIGHNKNGSADMIGKNGFMTGPPSNTPCDF